jgi:glycosyltransferase involved in cell wall biosynthesis
MSGETAFVYDFLLVEGGAEKLALHVKKQFPHIDLVFGFIDRSVFPQNRYPDHIYRALTGPTGITGWQGLKAMSAFSRNTAFLENYQTVIFSGAYAPLAVKHHRRGRNIYYCHALPRFVYDLKDYYLEQASGWQKPLLKSLIAWTRPRFEASMEHMDLIIANSANVKKRFETYLRRSDVEVIHPPIETGSFSWLGQGDFYLSTARLEPYKRVESIVRAFCTMPDKRLIVASGGSQFERLRRLARDAENIEFTGWCSDEELRRLSGRCIATIYLPIDEDFGISPVESMAAGKPVIGAAEGGLLETVVPGETGLLIEPSALLGDQAVQAICEAVASLDRETALAMRPACEERARLFDSRQFDQRFAAALSDRLG